MSDDINLADVKELLRQVDVSVIAVLNYLNRELHQFEPVVARVPEWQDLEEKVGDWTIRINKAGCRIFTIVPAGGTVSISSISIGTIVSPFTSIPSIFSPGRGLAAAPYIEEIVQKTEEIIQKAKEQIAQQIPIWQRLVDKFAPISVLERLGGEN